MAKDKIQKLLEILVCPLTKAPLMLEGDRLVSTDPETRKVYRIDDGIPVMLINESTEMPADEHAALLQKHGAKPWSKPEKKKKVTP